MTYEQTKAICDEAHSLGLKVASHVESEEGVLIALRAGVDTIEHGSKLNSEAIKLFKENNSAFVSTLSPALPIALLKPEITKLSSFVQFNANVVYENMIACAKDVYDNNISMGLGTDASCPLVSQYNTWRELKYTKEILGRSASDTIYMATLGNAKILGLDKEIGSIEENKIADILVLDNNPLEDFKTLEKPYMIINKGCILKNKKIKHVKIIDEMIDKIEY